MSRTHKRQTVEGEIEEHTTRQTGIGHIAHHFRIGEQHYILFSDRTEAPVTVGDRARFVARRKTAARKGARHRYWQIDPASIEIQRPQAVGDAGDGGTVYVLKNSAFSRLRKIGFTRGNPFERARQLSHNTATPGQFKVEWSMYVHGDPAAVERAAHEELADKREDKEFFRVDTSRAKEVLQTVYYRLYPDRANEVDQTIRKRERAQLRSSQPAAHDRSKPNKNGEPNQNRSHRIASTAAWAQSGVIVAAWRPRLGPRDEPRNSQGRLFRRPAKPSNWISVSIEGSGPINAGGGPPWRLSVRGVLNNRWMHLRNPDGPATIDHWTMADAVREARDILCSYTFASVDIRVSIPCTRVENPRPPAGGQPLITSSGYSMPVDSLKGWRLRYERCAELASLEDELLKAVG